MTKRYLLFALTVSFVCSMSMAGVFSARSSLFIAANKHHQQLKLQDSSSPTSVKAFVTIDDEQMIEKLQASGVVVSSCFGKVVTASIPVERLEDVASLKGVKHIDVAQRYSLCNGKALSLSHFPTAHYSAGSTSDLFYTGSGVIVGVIDVGVDFNHVNFMDGDGRNRIVRAYLPGDTTGHHPVINGLQLPGSEYVTAEQIATLTTDDVTETHGTHTTGTAAGSYMANGYNGVATGAQIVVCAMPEDSLNDVNIANSLNYIFNYADQVGLPAVVNMSFGSQDGAHDGTSMLCRLFDDLSGPGRICVVSAGNDGAMSMHIEKTFAQNDSLATFLADFSGSRVVMKGYSSMWSSTSSPHTIQLMLWDTQADSLIHRLDLPLNIELDSVYTISSENDTIFAKYMTGELYVVSSIEDNGRFHSIVETNYSCIDKKRYRLGAVYKTEAGVTLKGWCGNSVVYSRSQLSAPWVSGVKWGSISDLATGEDAISVGAYCSTKDFEMLDGHTVSYSNVEPYDIAYFSGYGPDARGVTRPDVVAPGYALVSSVSRFDEAYDSPGNVVDNVEYAGDSYPYGIYWGTSMSAPVVTGAIALWLSIDPKLSPGDIRSLLQSTCYKDEWVTGGDAMKWGYGKLDIDAAVKQLLQRLKGDINGDGVVNAADITCLYNIILGISSDHLQRADVNRDDVINAADVTIEYNVILGM